MLELYFFFSDESKEAQEEIVEEDKKQTTKAKNLEDADEEASPMKTRKQIRDDKKKEK